MLWSLGVNRLGRANSGAISRIIAHVRDLIEAIRRSAKKIRAKPISPKIEALHAPPGGNDAPKDARRAMAAAPSDPLTSPGCWDYEKRLFVRADPLDNFYYDLDPTLKADTAAAKGATASYTNDRLAGTQSATVNGRLSYVVFGQHC